LHAFTFFFQRSSFSGISGFHGTEKKVSQDPVLSLLSLAMPIRLRSRGSWAAAFSLPLLFVGGGAVFWEEKELRRRVSLGAKAA